MNLRKRLIQILLLVSILFLGSSANAESSRLPPKFLFWVAVKFLFFSALEAFVGFKVGDWIQKRNLATGGRVFSLFAALIAGVFLLQVLNTVIALSLDTPLEDPERNLIAGGYAFGMIFHFFRKRPSENGTSSVDEKKDSLETHQAIKPSGERLRNMKAHAAKEAHPEVHNVSPVDDLEFYTAVAKELKGGVRNDGLWLKARIESEGDEAKAEIAYATLRVDMLKAENSD